VKCWLIDSEYNSSLDDMQRGKAQDFDSSVVVLAESTVEAGDACVLWRSAADGGVIAIGEISGVRVERPVRLPPLKSRRAVDRPEPSRAWATVAFEKLMLSSPMSPAALREAGLSHVVSTARLAGDRAGLLDSHMWSRPGRRAAPLDLSQDEFRRMTRVAEDTQPPSDWPAAWNIPPGTVVSRSRLHKVYGGNPRVWAGHSGTTPNAFLFLRAGRGAEFAPCLEAGMLLAAGHGQWTNDVSRENLGVLAHLRRGVPLRVFMTSGSECLYLGEFVSDQARPVERWVPSGQRDLFGDGRSVRDVRTPVFRLRQLSGIPLPNGGTDPFQGAPKISLALHASDNQPAAAAVRGLLATLKDKPSVAAALGDLDEAQLLAVLLQRARRQAGLDKLRAAVENPETKEHTLRKLIKEMPWIFGGEFVREGRRDLTAQDELDLVLLRHDGSLHGVELKKATLKKPLAKRDHSHVIVGGEVSDAYGQAINYLRELDESRHQILAQWKIDCRRASMTIVIGRSSAPGKHVTPQEADEAIRTYNSHHSRVTVTTYDRLLENAQRMLDITPLTVP
jgi:hypothetical protein